MIPTSRACSGRGDPSKRLRPAHSPREQPHSSATSIMHPATPAQGHGWTRRPHDWGWSPVAQWIRPLGSATWARAGGTQEPQVGGDMVTAG